MTRSIRRQLDHYRSVSILLATIQISGQYLTHAAAFVPARGLAVRAPLYLRPDCTEVPNDDNPFLHPMRYVEALLFKPAAKRPEATSLRPAMALSSPGVAKPAEPAPVSTFAGGDSWSAPVPSQVAPATFSAPAPPSGGNYLTSLGGGAPVKKAPARDKPKVATKTTGGYFENMSSSNPASSWSAPAPPAVAPATFIAPAPPSGGNYLTSLGGGAPVKKTAARGKPMVATKTSGGYLDNMSSANSASSWSAPAPPAVAAATFIAPAPPSGGNYLSSLGGGVPIKKAPAHGKPKVATKTIGGYLENISSATATWSSASTFSHRSMSAISSQSNMSAISNASNGELESKGSNAGPNSVLLMDDSQRQPSSSSTQQRSRQESSLMKGTHGGSTAPSSLASSKEDGWKYEGFGNIGRGPGSNRRVRNRVARSTASSSQQQPSPSHESQVHPTDPIEELIGRIKTEIDLAREFFSRNEIQPPRNPIPPGPVANIVGSNASDSITFISKDLVLDTTPLSAKAPAPLTGGDYLSSLGSGTLTKKAPARGKPEAAARAMGGYLDNLSRATPASSWLAPLPSPATVSAPAPPAEVESATREVIEGLMTELDLAREFGDRAAREGIERLKTELELAHNFFSHNERK